MPLGLMSIKVSILQPHMAKVFKERTDPIIAIHVLNFMKHYDSLNIIVYTLDAKTRRGILVNRKSSSWAV